MHLLFLSFASRRQLKERRGVLVSEILAVERVHVELVLSSEMERTDRFHHLLLRLLFPLRSFLADSQNLLDVFILLSHSPANSTVKVPFSDANTLSAP